jgi:pantoate--beta-alanine ligase
MAKSNADKTVVSIFLNPTQFGKGEDFDSYPRTIDSDLIELDNCKVDAVFIPETEQIYPPEWSFNYDIGELSTILCGKSRPNFFNGVAQAVYRLFDIVKPDIAVFGQKDYQQLFIIKRMVEQLSLGVVVLTHSTVREGDELAMSTRNQYLSSEERAVAPQLYKILERTRQDYLLSSSVIDLKKDMHSDLEKYFDLDYAEIVDANTLKQITDNTTEIAILCAVLLGSTRLIDNIIFWR